MDNNIFIPFFEKIDHGGYCKAVRQACDSMKSQCPFEMAEKTGALYDTANEAFRLLCYNHILQVKYPEGRVTIGEGPYYPATELWIMVMNYLARGDGTPLTDTYLPYRQFPDGQVFDTAFHNLAVKPLSRKYGHNLARLANRAELYGGIPEQDRADSCLVFQVLPRLKIKVRVWEGDEEVPPSANMLFSDNCAHYLHIEDLSVLGSYLTGLLVGQWRRGSF